MYNNNTYVVYVLRSKNPNYSRKTYVGCTKDRHRRLRQHNREIKGGAKRTLVGTPWEMVCYFSGFPDKRTAYQLEYAIHHSGMKKTKKRTKSGKIRTREVLSNNYRGGGLEKRIKLITLALEKTSFTQNSIPVSYLRLTLNWLVPNLQLPTSFPYIIEVPYSNINNNIPSPSLLSFQPIFSYNSPPSLPQPTFQPTFYFPFQTQNIEQPIFDYSSSNDIKPQFDFS